MNKGKFNDSNKSYDDFSNLFKRKSFNLFKRGNNALFMTKELIKAIMNIDHDC